MAKIADSNCVEEFCSLYTVLMCVYSIFVAFMIMLRNNNNTPTRGCLLVRLYIYSGQANLVQRQAI